MEPKIEPQLLLEDWAVKSEAEPKLSPAAETQGSRVRKKPGPKPTPNANRNQDVYRIWKAMRNRCNNPNAKDFKHYGGRGIVICEPWNDFKVFEQDMGPRPTKKHEIDRKDNDGNYESGNCCWATRKQQLQHTRRNRIIEYQGQTLTLQAWADKFGIGHKVLSGRLDRGWTIEKALSSVKYPSGNRNPEALARGWETRRRNQKAAL